MVVDGGGHGVDEGGVVGHGGHGDDCDDYEGNNGDDGGHELEREENVMFVLNWIEGQGRFKAEILLK